MKVKDNGFGFVYVGFKWHLDTEVSRKGKWTYSLELRWERSRMVFSHFLLLLGMVNLHFILVSLFWIVQLTESLHRASIMTIIILSQNMEGFFNFRAYKICITLKWAAKEFPRITVELTENEIFALACCHHKPNLIYCGDNVLDAMNISK